MVLVEWVLAMCMMYTHQSQAQLFLSQVDAEWVVQAVNNLPVPTDFVDPVTQVC